MEAIWDLNHRSTVRDVMDAAFPNGEKAYTTVMTVMNTLEKKGFLKREKIGMVNFYTALFTRADMVAKETKNFVSKVFHGSMPALASYLLNTEDIDTETLEAMKAVIDQREAKLKGEDHD